MTILTNWKDCELETYNMVCNVNSKDTKVPAGVFEYLKLQYQPMIQFAPGHRPKVVAIYRHGRNGSDASFRPLIPELGVPLGIAWGTIIVPRLTRRERCQSGELAQDGGHGPIIRQIQEWRVR